MSNIGYNYSELARVAPQCDDRILRFDVYRKRTGFDGQRFDECIISFDEEDQAIAFVGNTETHYGADLCVREVDVRTDDEVCILAAEWDEDHSRYMN
ncbi:hypothetical protein [Bradyrhizobium sp.]|uniref:hypothetical protein n=1 Tax=Bradyrhizobium sp. TaxID=376 RepID=UPI002735238A|nr:hypothetical protein [Bradyrhizobium sp.]MDP3078653.1 hypothetical protein [Bradyrhizobium sp.]